MKSAGHSSLNIHPMSIEIKKVASKADLKKFIRFNYEMYKDNPYSLPDMSYEKRYTFSP